MKRILKRAGIILGYVALSAIVLNWLYSLEVFSSCIVVSPRCSGWDCELMGAALECTPSIWWYIVAGILLVLPVTVWLVVRYTTPKKN